MLIVLIAVLAPSGLALLFALGLGRAAARGDLNAEATFRALTLRRLARRRGDRRRGDRRVAAQAVAHDRRGRDRRTLERRSDGTAADAPPVAPDSAVVVPLPVPVPAAADIAVANGLFAPPGEPDRAAAAVGSALVLRAPLMPLPPLAPPE